MKAGTTSLHRYLNQHPEIHMASLKEPHFFLRPDEQPPVRRVGELEPYAALFDSSAPARGESSPTYTCYPRFHDVPSRIAALVPEAKFIYLVRNPIDRIVSHYMHNVASDGVRVSFEEHVGNLSDSMNPYVYPCLYAAQLDQYLQVFREDRLLVVDQAELRADRAACLRAIFAFLRVDPAYESQLFEREYGTARDRRQFPAGYGRLVTRLSRTPARVLPQTLRRSVRRGLERALWPALEEPVVSEQAREQLRSACAADVERLRRLTGTRFATWDM